MEIGADPDATLPLRPEPLPTALKPNDHQNMNLDSITEIALEDPADTRPILIVPYMWIGDFVRCHSVVRLLKGRFPNRPVDVLTTTLCAPLLDYMPGVRKGIVWDLPRRRLALKQHWSLATRVTRL